MLLGTILLENFAQTSIYLRPRKVGKDFKKPSSSTKYLRVLSCSFCLVLLRFFHIYQILSTMHPCLNTARISYLQSFVVFPHPTSSHIHFNSLRSPSTSNFHPCSLRAALYPNPPKTNYHITLPIESRNTNKTLYQTKVYGRVLLEFFRLEHASVPHR